MPEKPPERWRIVEAERAFFAYPAVGHRDLIPGGLVSERISVKGKSEANAAAGHGDDRAREAGLAMTRENLLHQGDLCRGWYVRKADDAGMCCAGKLDERPEIRIDRHQNAALFGR